MNYSDNHSTNIEERMLKYELLIEDLQLKQKLKEEEKKYLRHKLANSKRCMKKSLSSRQIFIIKTSFI
jgi:hypothetical protein